MGLSAKWSKSTPDGWAGFLLISFPPQTPSPSSSSSSRLLTSTLSICGLLLLTTFLLFTLSPFDPPSSLHLHRRLLLNDAASSFKAMQGMGALYRRGTRAMPELIVAHVGDKMDERYFRSFLRILHTSGLLARSDLVFLFSSSSISRKFSPVIKEENGSLMKLINELNRTSHHPHPHPGLTRYMKGRKDGKKESKEAIWGKGIRFKEMTNSSELDESNRPGYGSVVGFDASELDPENSLVGFIDHVPMGLRRWACYPMLLGRVRRSYKHVLLADVESVLVLNDPFSRVRSRSPESVLLWTHPDTEPKRGKRQSQSQSRDPAIIPGIIVGGCRGVRRLSDAVLTEIVRAAIDHKKNAVTESGVVNQIVRSGHLLKNVNVVIQAEPIVDAKELFGSGSSTGSVYSSNTLVVYRGNGISNRDRVLM